MNMNNKQLTIALIIGLIFISIWWIAYSRVSNVEEPVENTTPVVTEETEEQSQETQEETVTTIAPTPQPTTPAVTQEIETPEEDVTPEDALPERETPEDIEIGAYVKAVFAGDNSKRCTWTDRDTGLDGMALIKDGKVRVETEQDEAEPRITLYNSAATYIWVEGEREGTVIPNDFDGTDTVVTYQTRSEIAEYLETNEWVDCDPQTLSDGHFIPPKNVSFTQPDKYDINI
jgi:cytoskeletal protein RodZ